MTHDDCNAQHAEFLDHGCRLIGYESHSAMLKEIASKRAWRMSRLVFYLCLMTLSYVLWCYGHSSTIAERTVQTVTITPAPYQGSHDD